MNPEIIIGSYERLKNYCNLVRYEVFVKEQNVPEDLEIDDQDIDCNHIILMIDNYPIATGRIDIENQGKIGRIAVLKKYRNRGYGRIILENLEQIARQNYLKSVWLNAQKSSIRFYQKLGYQIVGDEFLEANIIHQKMNKNLTIYRE